MAKRSKAYRPGFTRGPINERREQAPRRRSNTWLWVGAAALAGQDDPAALGRVREYLQREVQNRVLDISLLLAAVWWAVNRYAPHSEARTLLDVLANLAHNATLAVIMAEVCLIYATPAQMILFVNGLQWTGYRKLDWGCVGESSCADSWGRALSTGEPTWRFGSLGPTAIVPAGHPRPIQLRHDCCSQMRMPPLTVLS